MVVSGFRSQVAADYIEVCPLHLEIWDLKLNCKGRSIIVNNDR
jgi:hypothetical protein